MSNYRNTDIERFATQLKALANASRLKIFLRLVSCCGTDTGCGVDPGSACVGEVGGDLGLAPSTVSHHLRELQRAGLIATRRSGQRIECWVPRDALETLAGFFGACCDGKVVEPIPASEGNTEGSSR